ncbi:MAG: hypothetical protein V3T80_12060 [Kiloniellales bacterium]
MTRSFAGTAILAVLAAALVGRPTTAGEADVVKAQAVPGGGGSWRFHVTVAHDDKGWDHYADKWDVVGPDGTLLGTRVLLHPHEKEQPFTRSLGGVNIPKGVEEVTLRAHDSEHGYGGNEVTVKLPE